MTVMQGRVDRPGSDFANFSLPGADPLLCQGECGRNAGCVAWTYAEPSADGPARCALKNAIPAGVANGQTVSGTK